jgi:hypothetical protein
MMRFLGSKTHTTPQFLGLLFIGAALMELLILAMIEGALRG